MRQKIVKLSILPAVGALIFLSFSTKGNDEIYEPKKADLPAETELPLLNFNVDTSLAAYPVLQKDYTGFKAAVSFKESQGQYHLINSFGYMGKYQFGEVTLAALGICDTQDFLTNPILQEEAFYAFLARNKWILQKDIDRYVGQTIDGVEVTESGILAAAHLAGPGGIRKFLRSGGANSSSDAFGTTVKHYLKQFGGYDISNVQPHKNATVQMFFANR